MAFDPSATRSGLVFSDNPNYAMAFICYVNGLEIPIVGFDVNYGVWQIPSFQIHLVPDPVVTRLGAEDRVQVALFYLDYHVDPAHPEFRLLCDGEIVGWSFQNQGVGRTVSFQCMAHVHLFQQLYFFYMTSVDDVVAAQAPDVQAQGFTSSGLLYPYALFHNGLFVSQPSAATGSDGATPSAAPSINVPYELVYNVVKGIISNGIRDNLRAVPMMNFFARHTRTTRFQNRWVRLPIFEDGDTIAQQRGVFPIFKAAENDAALDAMQRNFAPEVASSGPVWDLLKQVLSITYMEIAMVPNPACVQVSLGGPGDKGAQDAGSIPGVAKDGMILGGLTDVAPITQVSSTTADAARTRAQALYDQLSRLVAQGASYDPALLTEAGITTPNPTPADVNLNAIYDHLLAGSSTSGASASTASLIAGQQSGFLTTDPLRPVRLAQYFVKPQFLFGIPPVCNVFFPSMVDTWGFDENYINQPTRVYVNDAVMTRLLRAQHGPNREFMLHALSVGWPAEANDLLHEHLAGSLDDSDTGGSGAPDARSSGRNLLLWPEEYYKGPVTSRIELPRWFQILIQFHNANPNSPDETSDVPAAAGALAVTAPATVTVTGTPTRGLGSGAAATQPSGMGASTATQDATGVANTGGPIVGNPTSGSTTPGAPDAVGVRLVVGGRPRIILDGQYPGRQRAHARFELSLGGGLDPTNYLDLTQTSLWPRPPTNTGDVRLRGRPSPRNGFRDRTVSQKLAQLHRLFARFVPDEFSSVSFSPDQLMAMTLGFVWIALTEGVVQADITHEHCYCWDFGNTKQYTTFPATTWTVQPDKQPYKAARTPEDGAVQLIEDCKTHYPVAIQALLGNVQGLPAELRAFLQAQAALADDFWQRYAPIRPDWFYMALGYIGYYETEGDVAGANNKVRRAQLGLSRVGTIKGRFQGILAAYQAGVPDDVRVAIPVPHRPIITADDLAFLRSQPGATSTPGTYPVPSAFAAHVAQAETTSGGVEPLRTSAPDGSVTSTAQGAIPGPYPAPGTQLASTTPAASPVEGDDQLRGGPFARLFELYAQYEYTRQRYVQRQAGVAMRFNPYVVPGFPCVLLDSMRTRFHFVGYVQNVSHSGQVSNGAGSMATQVSTICARTLPEFLNDIRNDAWRFHARVLAAPAETVPEIRAIIQDEAQADTFYRQLFYAGAARPGGLPYTFKVDQFFGYAEGLLVNNLQIQGDAVASVVANDAATTALAQAESDSPTGTPTATPSPPPPTPSGLFGENLNPDRELSPTSNVAAAFDSHNLAMQIVARPVCSLHDYIRFWYGGRSLTDLQANHYVVGPETTYAYAEAAETDVTATTVGGLGRVQGETGLSVRVTAIYYKRIYSLRPGPGPFDPQGGGNTQPPTVAQRGYTDGGPNGPFHASATVEGVPSDYPETRSDWDVMLEAYRDRVRLLLRPGV